MHIYVLTSEYSIRYLPNIEGYSKNLKDKKEEIRL